MRRALFTLLLGLAAVPTVAPAQLPPLPPPPTVTTPTVPLPLPLPLPIPTVPAPAPPAPPSVPGPPAAPQPPAESRSGAPTGAVPSSSGTSRSSSLSGRATPKRRASVVLVFRAPVSGRVAIPLTQVAPVCRSAGRLLFDARYGPNRFRFDGRVAGRPLPDGTYVAETPSGKVRFAIRDGKPTRSPRSLSPSVCGSGVLASATTPPPAGRTAAAPAANNDRDATDEPGPLPRVLGTSLTEAVEAAGSLHPALYVVLALAMVALAAATMPARAVPVATAGAVLARHRAALTLAGTLCLLLVIVGYWVTLV